MQARVNPSLPKASRLEIQAADALDRYNAEYAEVRARRVPAQKLGLPLPPIPPAPVELIQEAARLWANGWTTIQIGRKFGRTEGSMRHLIYRSANRRLFPRRPQRFTTDAERKLILRLYECGLSTGTIGKLLSFSGDKVYETLHARMGVPTRDTTKVCVTRRIPPSEIARCLLAGLSFRQIAQAMNQSHRAIEGIIRRCGLLRPAIEQLRTLTPRAWDEYRDALDDLRCHVDALDVAREYV